MLETFFQTTSKQVLTKYEKQLNQISVFEEQYSKLTDSDLKKKTLELKSSS
jgi:preprotein translocase subunit SecA